MKDSEWSGLMKIPDEVLKKSKIGKRIIQTLKTTK
jgi:hypothetical protein